MTNGKLRMTKFSVEKMGKARERLGSWELPNQAPIQSPGIWLTTSACGVPNLTPETYEMSVVQQNFAGLLVSYENHARSIDVFEAYQKGFLSFSGFKDMPTLLTVMDPMLKMKSGYNNSNKISVWGQNNQREGVDNAHYLKGVTALSPDAFVTLADSDMSKETASKRVQKALKYTHSGLEFVLNHHNDKVQDKVIIGSLEGHFDKKVRETESKLLSTLPLDGYLLDNFHSNGESSLEMEIDEVIDVLKESIMPHLKRDKPKMFFGMLDPLKILYLVKEGVDFFETSYVYNLTDKGYALSFTNTLESKEAISEELPAKTCEDKTGGNDVDFCIDLKDPKYKNDFGPILKDCSCYACRKHTRGYINHLLATNELLASVLLVIHNLHHYGDFFKTIREAIKNDKLDAFISVLKNE